MNLRKNLGLSIGIGILSMTWVAVCNKLGWASWPGFIGWSVFFYSGADLNAAREVTPCLIYGVVLAQLAMWAQGLVSGGILFYIPIFLLAFLMTYGQNIRALATAPATFLGSATHFATGGNLTESLGITLLGVLVLGLITIPVVKIFNQLIPYDEK